VTVTDEIRAQAAHQRELAAKACDPIAAQLRARAARRLEVAAAEVVFAAHDVEHAEERERAVRATPDAPG
jgi:hypothetical protein